MASQWQPTQLDSFMSEMSGDIWCSNIGNVAKDESDAIVLDDLQMFSLSFIEIYEYDGGIVEMRKNECKDE